MFSISVHMPHPLNSRCVAACSTILEKITQLQVRESQQLGPSSLEQLVVMQLLVGFHQQVGSGTAGTASSTAVQLHISTTMQTQ